VEEVTQLLEDTADQIKRVKSERDILLTQNEQHRVEMDNVRKELKEEQAQKNAEILRVTAIKEETVRDNNGLKQVRLSHPEWLIS